MRFIQLNLNNCLVAQDLLRQTVAEKEIDVAIISEPYRIPVCPVWVADKTSKASIWVCGTYPFQEIAVREENGYVAAKVNGIYIFSCYAAPSLTFQEFEQLADNIAQDASRHKPCIIAGDFNAWAEEWGSRLTNARGQALLEAFAGCDLVLTNVGEENTFRGHGGGAGSIIDLTFMSSELAKKAVWKLSEDYTGSDHQAIIIEMPVKGPRQDMDKERRGKATKKGWVAKAMDAEVVKVIINDVRLPETTAEEMAIFATSKLTEACDASMPIRRMDERRRPAYWWNDTIKELRSKCFHARRRSQRAANTPAHEEERQKYKDARKELRDEIRRSKRQSFKNLCEEADANPWGGAYRLVMARLGNRAPAEKDPIVLKSIITELFPPQNPECTIYARPAEVEEIPEVTVEEVLAICSKVGTKKAPGPDEIPNGVLKTAVACNPSLFVGVIQACLVEGTVPIIWKKQKLVLLPKPGKQPGEASARRPICLLDTFGKMLESAIQNRLTTVTEGANGLSEDQFGFRKERSTLDAIKKVAGMAKEAICGKRWKGGTMKYCAIITLDIKNAFNSANWGHIMNALQEMEVPWYLLRIIGSYFKDRVLLYDTEDGTKEYKVTGGVPQGSVLGPILWNIMYDRVLRLNLPDETKIVGFADDIVIVVTAKYLDEVELIANESIATVKNWIESVGLALAEHKTEALLVSGRKIKEKITIKVGTHNIESKDEIRYLGVILDSKLKFKAHIRYACEKAAKVHASLARMLCNIGGPRSSRRMLLARVVSSTALYGAQIWADALQLQENRRRMLSIHRLTALRVTSAFRTVSLEAACVIAGMMPIDIAADEAKRLFEGKIDGKVSKENRMKEEAASLQTWQQRWDAADKGRWTHRLIPSVEVWKKRKHGEVNYHLTQFLTGHGCYRKYLHRFGHDESPLCPTCGEDEDAEHVTFKCSRFQSEREELFKATNEELRPDNIVTEMLRSQDVWNAVCSAVKTINEELRALEVIRRNS